MQNVADLEMLNIAIFGGAFNPIHWGHLLIAETAFAQFKLDRVIWVPTFCPPHKAQSLAAFEHRLEMVQHAIADHPAFTVSDVDRQREGVSYAIDTLRDLQAVHPHTRWYWIVGYDAFLSLPRWQASHELIEQCFWLVAPRATAKGDEGDEGTGGQEDKGENERFLYPTPDTPHPIPPCPHPAPLHWHWLEAPRVELSSSLIRQRCQEGRSIRYLVPETVRCYISAQNLYQ